MMNRVMSHVMATATVTAKKFKHEEDGIALTEYLLLLGLLTAAVIAAVTLFGTNLSVTWDAWARWMAGLPAPVEKVFPPAG